MISVFRSASNFVKKSRLMSKVVYTGLLVKVELCAVRSVWINTRQMSLWSACVWRTCSSDCVVFICVRQWSLFKAFGSHNDDDGNWPKPTSKHIKAQCNPWHISPEQIVWHQTVIYTIYIDIVTKMSVIVVVLVNSCHRCVWTLLLHFTDLPFIHSFIQRKQTVWGWWDRKWLCRLKHSSASYGRQSKRPAKLFLCSSFCVFPPGPFTDFSAEWTLVFAVCVWQRSRDQSWRIKSSVHILDADLKERVLYLRVPW